MSDQQAPASAAPERATTQQEAQAPASAAPGQASSVRHGWLLTLPDGMEDAFWASEAVARRWVPLDRSACTLSLLGTLMLARSIAPLVASDLRDTWPTLASCLILGSTAALALAFMSLAPAAYTRHRSRIVLAQRRIRLVLHVLLMAGTGERGFQLLGRRLDARSGDPSAVRILLRITYLMPAYFGNPAFNVVPWRHVLWLQAVNLALVLPLAHSQHRRIMASAELRCLLRPTCRSMALHWAWIARLVPQLGLPPPQPSAASEAACSDPSTAALALLCFGYVSCVLFAPCLVWCWVERALKASWVHAACGRRLVGPWPAWLAPAGAGADEGEPRDDGGSLHAVVQRGLSVARDAALIMTLSSALWGACLAAAARLAPHLPLAVPAAQCLPGDPDASAAVSAGGIKVALVLWAGSGGVMLAVLQHAQLVVRPHDSAGLGAG